MNTTSLTDKVSVSGQMKPADLGAIKASGIEVIVNNRPDGEAPGQPRSSELADAASKLGLSYYYIPITPGQMSEKNVEDFSKVMQETDGKILAFCRSGMRSSTLWAFASAGEIPVSDILEKAAQAGYDLSPMRGGLTAYEAQKKTTPAN